MSAKRDRETTRVVVIDPNGKQRTFRFSQKEVTIGRGSQNDVMLDGDDVSDTHARIVEKQGKYVVFDLKSEGGILVNRRRITAPHIVSRRDEIRIGAFALRVAGEHAAPVSVEAGRTVCPRCGGPLSFRNLADYCNACDLAFG